MIAATLVLDNLQPYAGTISGPISIQTNGTVLMNQDNALGGYSNAGPSVYLGSGGTLNVSSGIWTHMENLQLDGGTLLSPVAVGTAAYYGTYDVLPGFAINVTSSSTIAAQNVSLEPVSGTLAAAQVNVSSEAVLSVTGSYGDTANRRAE